MCLKNMLSKTLIKGLHPKTHVKAGCVSLFIEIHLIVVNLPRSNNNTLQLLSEITTLFKEGHQKTCIQALPSPDF